MRKEYIGSARGHAYGTWLGGGVLLPLNDHGWHSTSMLIPDAFNAIICFVHTSSGVDVSIIALPCTVSS